MNPTIPQAFLEAERQRDPEFFSREYDSQFSDSISNAFSREAVEACVVTGRYELFPVVGKRYFAAVDPSGGGADEFTLSVGHRENGRIIQDCLRAWRSSKPQQVVKECCEVLSRYHCGSVVGDRYSGEWVRESFRGPFVQVRGRRLDRQRGIFGAAARDKRRDD